MQAGREADTLLCVVVGFGFRVYGYRQAGSHLVMREAVRGHELLVVDRPLDGAHLRLRVHLECSSACKLVRERERGRERESRHRHARKRERGRKDGVLHVRTSTQPPTTSYLSSTSTRSPVQTHTQTNANTHLVQAAAVGSVPQADLAVSCPSLPDHTQTVGIGLWTSTGCSR